MFLPFYMRGRIQNHRAQKIYCAILNYAALLYFTYPELQKEPQQRLFK